MSLDSNNFMEGSMRNKSYVEFIEASKPLREIFREATVNAIRPIIDRHVRENDKIIEIGSGLGYLAEKLLPEYKDRIQQTEPQTEVYRKHLELYPDSNVMNTDAQKLLLGKHTFNAAMGLNVFDEMHEPDFGLISVGRSLDNNGKIIHIRDLRAAPQSPSFFDYDRDRFIPFPTFDKSEMYQIGIRLVPINDAKNTYKTHPDIRQGVMQYVRNPEEIYQHLMSQSDRTPLKLLARAGQKLAPKARIINFENYFSSRLESALKQTGYEILESGNADGIAVVEREDRHSRNPRDNLLHNNAGWFRREFDAKTAKELEPNQVKLISTVKYAVAKKDISYWTRIEEQGMKMANTLEALMKRL